jgi:hypothetical protein
MQAIFLLPQQTKEARNIGQSDVQRTQSEQKRGRTLLPETKTKSSEALKGKPRKPHSPETCARISEAKKGKPRSLETRAKIAATNKGKTLSPEHRARISEALQRRWSERRKQQTEQLARGRKTALTLHLTPAERQTLRAWQRATTIPAGLARRGRIILLLADGMTITAIMKTVGISRRFVYKWVQRFLEQGVEGLVDKPGRGGRRRGPGPSAVSAPPPNRHVG